MIVQALRRRLNLRALARLRREFPAAFYVPGLVTGQLLVYWLGGWVLAGLAAAGAAAALVGVKAWRSVTYLAAAAGAITMYAALPEPLSFSAAGRYQASAWVDQEPRYRRPGEVELSLFLVHVSGGVATPQVCGHRLLCRAVHLPWKNIAVAKVGTRFEFEAEIQPLRSGWNPFSYEATLFRHGYAGRCRIIYAARPSARRSTPLAAIRARLLDRIGRTLADDERRGLLLSLSLGARDRLSQRTETAFKRAGLAHLLVFSGYQVTVAYYGVFFILQTLAMRWVWLLREGYAFRLARGGALLAGLLLAALTGLEGSSLRAALAAALVVIGNIIERSGPPLNAVCASFIGVSLIWPGCCFEPGMQLTFAALVGLCLGAADGAGPVGRYIHACLGASLLTSIVALCWFNQISWIGFALNPVAAPLAGLVGCQAVFGAIAIYLIGVDHYGSLLNLLAAGIGYFRNAVIYLGSLPWAASEVQGWSKAGLVTLMVAVAGHWIRLRLRSYLQEHNLLTPTRPV